MHQSEEEKIELEHQAAKIFMRWYEKNTGKPIRHIWHNEPIRPDVSCMLEGERLDLEIAHLYGSEEEAMAILGRELTNKTRQAIRDLAHDEVNSRLLKALNRILENKSGKRYDSKRVWLVIRNAHPAWSKSEIKALEHLITIPEPHAFEKVWIVGDMEGKTGIVRLYP
ncbi:hypothetical protein MSP8887_02562 [Marinomonas spartinae]|uniref:Uncharacterized protein n=1 Tax=Marinomonas spartinae TaxID=1792290 RepID=A0A1A8TD66_9GAMM|nr:hypothetical protein [Marinomonas spartinae]SBS30729.1 hypothetical protein MSP8886_01907 [Marinomonas spartinae]SBS36339.1 hypothetical protein MSP8887_02562 [Marinomonas spartinae]